MPANLPPPYFEAEKRYREAKTPEAKIEALEEMLTIMPKHKGTDKLRADLRHRIAKCKAEQQKKGVSKKGASYAIAKEGAAQVVVVGPPNTGKSSLVAAFTNASPEVAAFPHSTWKPTPGMANFENIQFQLIDTPPISTDYVDPWMVDMIRRADMVLLLLDLHADPLQQLDDSLGLLRGMRIFPKGQSVPEGLEKKPFIKKILVAVNKVDAATDEEDFQAFLELSEVPLPCVPLSIRSGFNFKSLLQGIYDLSDLVRVYSKAPGKEPDSNSPFVVPRGTTLGELAGKIHRDFEAKLKFAKIWGEAVYDGQMVQRDYVLNDGDVVELHI